MQAKALEIGETLAYPTPDGRFVIALQRTDHSYAVTVENSGGFRVDELCRTFGTEFEARDLARDISKRLRDGATVDEVVAAIQPAAELIFDVTAHLALVTAAKALTLPQQRAILAADGVMVYAGNGVSVSTLRAMAKAGAGTLIYRTDGRRKVLVALRLNDYGQRIKRALADLHVLAA